MDDTVELPTSGPLEIRPNLELVRGTHPFSYRGNGGIGVVFDLHLEPCVPTRETPSRRCPKAPRQLEAIRGCPCAVGEALGNHDVRRRSVRHQEGLPGSEGNQLGVAVVERRQIDGEVPMRRPTIAELVCNEVLAL